MPESVSRQVGEHPQPDHSNLFFQDFLWGEHRNEVSSYQPS
jgi:hypothetical protein